MSYTKHTWQAGESVTAEKLNNIETGIESAAEGGNVIEPFIITVTQINYTSTGYSLPTNLQTSAAFTQAIIDAKNADRPIIVQYVPLSGSSSYKDSKPYYFAGAPYTSPSEYYFVNPYPRYDGTAEVCVVNTNSTNCVVAVTTRTFLPTNGTPSTENILMRQDTGAIYWGQIENDDIGYLRLDGDTNDGTVYWENVPSSISYDIASVFDDGIAQKILNKLCIYDTDTIYTNSYTARPYVLKRAYTTYDYDNENYDPGECERAVLEFEQVELNYNSHIITYRRILLVGIMWRYSTLGSSTPFSFTADPMYNDFFARYYEDTHYIDGMDSNNILTYSHGGTGTNSLKTLSQKMFKQCAADGSDDLAVLTTYPVNKPGVYRVGQPNITGLPTGISGYGCLVIFNGGSYWLHMYMDSNNGIYFARKDSTAVPTTWYKATTSSVAAKT